MKIEIRNGDDWVAVYVDGKEFYAGHDIPQHAFVTLLERFTGVEISVPDGNFCAWCTKWTTLDLLRANDGDGMICPACKAEENA